MRHQTTALAIDILVIEETTVTVPQKFSLKKKKKCCDKIIKGKQCKRCPLLNIV